MKIRLDKIILEKELVRTIKEAQALIMTGRIIVNGKVCDKPGTLTPKDAEVIIKEKFPYVSRGALKIEKAYQEFNLNFMDKIVCDIGSSTGGFTDFVLQHGAKQVFAIDVGHGQLDQKLREDKRVAVMERTDFRKVVKLPESIDYFLCDVSFISLKKMLPHIKQLTANSQQPKAYIIALIKPQFEASDKEVARGKGIIKSEQLRLEIIEEIKNFAQDLGFEIQGLAESPIRGTKGNVEYLLYLKTRA
ncbi:MAG: TlyA family RNA methyltransferase [Patescibacteria group bacterium]